MKKTNYIAAMALTSLIAFGCQKETTQTVTNVQSTVVESPTVENDMLVFPNAASYNKTLQEVSKMSQSEFLNWEKSLGLKTQEGLIQAMITEENEGFAKTGQHGNLYNLLLNKGVIKAVKNNDGTISVENISANNGWSRFINIDGNMIIGDKLFHFTEKQIGIAPVENGKNWQNLQFETRSRVKEQKANNYDWSQTGAYYNWVEGTTPMRAREVVTGTSLLTTILGASTCIVNYNVKVEIQTDASGTGTWAMQNNTCVTLRGSWTLTYGLQATGSASCNAYKNLDETAGSPQYGNFLMEYASTNNVSENPAFPNGAYVNLTDYPGFVMCDAINVDRYNWSAQICVNGTPYFPSEMKLLRNP